MGINTITTYLKKMEINRPLEYGENLKDPATILPPSMIAYHSSDEQDMSDDSSEKEMDTFTMMAELQHPQEHTYFLNKNFITNADKIKYKPVLIQIELVCSEVDDDVVQFVSIEDVIIPLRSIDKVHFFIDEFKVKCNMFISKEDCKTDLYKYNNIDKKEYHVKKMSDDDGYLIDATVQWHGGDYFSIIDVRVSCLINTCGFNPHAYA